MCTYLNIIQQLFFSPCAKHLGKRGTHLEIVSVVSVGDLVVPDDAESGDVRVDRTAHVAGAQTTKMRELYDTTCTSQATESKILFISLRRSSTAYLAIRERNPQ